MLRKLSEPYVVGVASRVIGQAISFVAVAVASRYLDLDAFGTYALAWAAVVIGNTFVFTGYYQALLRAPDFARDRDTLFWLKAGVGATSTVAILLAALMFGGLSSPSGAAMIALAPIPFLIVPTAWWEAQLVRAKRVRAASLYVLVAEAAGLAAAIWLLTQGWQIGALIASRYVSLAVGFVLTAAMVRNLPRLRFRRTSVQEAQKTAVPLWGTTTVHLFTNYGTDIILGAFASAAVIGAYRGGARIAVTASDLVLQPLGLLTWSRFTRIEKDRAGLAELRAAWIASMSIAAAILWPMTATVALLAPALVVTILDETWLPATGVVVILSISRAIGFLGALLEPTLMTTGRGRQQFAIRLYGAGTLLVLLFIFARYGAEAAAWTHVASSVLVAVLSLGAMMRALKLRPGQLVATFVPGVGATVLICAAILGTEVPRAALGTGAGLLASLAAVAVAWLAVMVLFLRRRVLVLPRP